VVFSRRVDGLRLVNPPYGLECCPRWRAAERVLRALVYIQASELLTQHCLAAMISNNKTYFATARRSLSAMHVEEMR
jgi:hypothetical protein